MNNGNETTIGEALVKMLQTLNLEDDVKEIKIKEAIQTMFNASVLNNIPKITFKKGLLIIYVTSHALRQDLFFGRGKLIKRMNEELGQNWIKEIRLQ